jgi:hypothetical protein
LRGEVKDGKLTLARIREAYLKLILNSEISLKETVSVLRELHFIVEESAGDVYYLKWNSKKMKSIFDVFIEKREKIKTIIEIFQFAFALLFGIILSEGAGQFIGTLLQGNSFNVNELYWIKPSVLSKDWFATIAYVAGLFAGLMLGWLLLGKKIGCWVTYAIYGAGVEEDIFLALFVDA